MFNPSLVLVLGLSLYSEDIGWTSQDMNGSRKSSLTDGFDWFFVGMGWHQILWKKRHFPHEHSYFPWFSDTPSGRHISKLFRGQAAACSETNGWCQPLPAMAMADPSRMSRDRQGKYHLVLIVLSKSAFGFQHSPNRGFLSHGGTPKSSISIGCSIKTIQLLGYSHFLETPKCSFNMSYVFTNCQMSLKNVSQGHRRPKRLVFSVMVWV